MTKSVPKLPTSDIDSRQLAAVFAALDAANARADDAENRMRDMEKGKVELLPAASLVVGFADGLRVAIDYFHGAASSSDLPANTRPAVEEIADVLEDTKETIIARYGANVTRKRTGTVHIKPV